MAGTCKYCSRKTWGRYKVCPDCRKERKRKGKGGYLSNKISGSGERWICNSCSYGWRSKKSFGGPAICPNCKGNNIIPYSESPQGKAEIVGKIIFSFLIVAFVFGAIFFGIYNNDIKPTIISNLSSNASQLKSSCEGLIKGYDNIKGTKYFENKTEALKYYVQQGFANNTASYQLSVCRINQLNETEKAIIYYRSVWWRSPLVCTEQGLIKCPNSEDVNDKSY